MSHILTRSRLLGAIAVIWLGAVAAIFAFTGQSTTVKAPASPVVVVHWATSHLMREGEGIHLLPVMADEFNMAGHTTQSGRPILVEIHNVPSQLIADYLIPRVNTGKRIDLTELTGGYVKPGYGDPSIVTPSSAHWLVTVNHEVGRDVVDLSAARSIVRPVIGIVTYQDMAECLGWPEKEIGYADIIALRSNPDGWASYSCAKA